MNKRYIGITIGPIVKTLMLTTTPAGLWGASYIFSYFVKRLIECLENDLKIKEKMFLVPARSEEVKGIVESCPWAGLFHDRIIFEIDDEGDYILEKVENCVEKVKDELAENLAGDLEELLEYLYEDKNYIKNYIKRYIQVHIILEAIKQDENPILVLGKSLDVLELQQSYVSNEKINYILKFLENREDFQSPKNEDRNSIIKKSFLLKNSKAEWHFIDEDIDEEKNKDKGNDNIFTIDDIAGIDKNRSKANTQTNKYYALIKTDGDNLGRVLQDMNKEIESEIQKFSIKCFQYASVSFEIIKEYGGKMIYAGGDDLLFITPVVGKIENRSVTVFDLLEKLNETFRNEFAEFHFYENGQPKLMGFSAGVIICYYKYPLCEALAGVLEQLENSKSVEGKNTISVHFEKHSGKKMEIKFQDFTNHFVYKKFLELLSEYTKGKRENAEYFLRSVNKKIEIYKELFILAIKKDFDNIKKIGKFNCLHKIVKNIFEEYSFIFCDETSINKTEEAIYIEKIIYLLEEIIKSKLQKIEKYDNNIVLKCLEELEVIVSLLSFYNEKEIK